PDGGDQPPRRAHGPACAPYPHPVGDLCRMEPGAYPRFVAQIVGVVRLHIMVEQPTVQKFAQHRGLLSLSRSGRTKFLLLCCHYSTSAGSKERLFSPFFVTFL